MQKQLRIISKHHLAVCPFSSFHFPVPALPPIVSGRHLSRLPIHFRPLPGVRVYFLSSIGWFLWVFPSGRRQLTALPF